MLLQLLPTPSAGWRVAMGLSCPSFSASSGLAVSGFPSGASCHLASGDWSTVLTTCHRQVNLKLLLKRKIRGRCQPASSCYKAGVALSKPPPSPLFPILICLLALWPGKGGCGAIAGMAAGERLEFFLGS